MTYGSYGPGPGPGPGPTGPQYPYGAQPVDPHYPYPSYGQPPGPLGYPPQGPGGYPPPGYPPQQYPPPRSNPMATLSIVFAFLFAPVGAILGHLALGRIKRTGEGGRDRALIGLTLSYAVIALAVLGLTASVVLAGRSADSPAVAANNPGMTPAPGMPSRPSPGQQAGTDLSTVLLSLDEVRSIMSMPGLSVTESKKGGSSGENKDASAEPAECVGAVAPGIDTVYKTSGASGYKRASFSDPDTASMVEQVAASFDSAADARSFVSKNRTQWQQCAGKQFTLTGGSSTLTWELGTPAGSATKVNLENTLEAGPGVPQLRVLATQGDVVIDISVISLAATDQADVIADQILARIPS